MLSGRDVCSSPIMVMTMAMVPSSTRSSSCLAGSVAVMAMGMPARRGADTYNAAGPLAFVVASAAAAAVTAPAAPADPAEADVAGRPGPVQ